MAKFNYKFAGIQKIKESFEKKAQKELSFIDITINKKQKQIVDLQNEVELHRSESRKKSIKVSELKFHQGFQHQIALKTEAIEKELLHLNNERERKLEELIIKSKEHKVLNKLEERHKEDFYSEQNKAESISIDEIAVQKFARRDK
jgi:flagellar export protein FliJ